MKEVEDEEKEEGNVLTAAPKFLWRRFVLLRPGMEWDDLKDSTKLRTSREWSWDERTPGTARTLVITAFVVTLFAIPALLANPTSLAWLIEFAALSREGVSPEDFFRSELFELTNARFNPTAIVGTVIGLVGYVGSILARTIEQLVP